MEKLSIEQKAKAYDKALEKAKEFKNNPFVGYDGTDLISALFPELAESEDEKIIKTLINYFNDFRLPTFAGLDPKKILAWLEKQDYTFEIKEGHWYKCVCDYMLDSSNLMFKNGRLYYCRSDWRLSGEIDERNVKDIGVNGYKSFFRPATNQEIKDWLEKQGEKKPADKIEPKFKVGDWIIYDRHISKVKDMDSECYLVEDTYGDEGVLFKEFVEKHYHLWTITDAKDGDVLATDDGNIFVFDGTVEEDKYPFAYCGLTRRRFESYDRRLPFTHNNVHPATKEQRDQLEKAMADAGYTFDFEKKELRKIKQKFAEWSEEDENRFNNLIFLVKCSDENEPTKKGFIDFINRLKSTSHQRHWKPSDEQIEALDDAIANCSERYCGTSYRLVSLRQDLNKLKTL